MDAKIKKILQKNEKILKRRKIPQNREEKTTTGGR